MVLILVSSILDVLFLLSFAHFIPNQFQHGSMHQVRILSTNNLSHTAPTLDPLVGLAILSASSSLFTATMDTSPQ